MAQVENFAMAQNMKRINTSDSQILPVVIVGKDRTRMTCAVIDHLKAHIKNATPYFICVSDRSRQGHDKVIENRLRAIGEEQFAVLHTLPEENRYGWGATINIGLECAFSDCKESPCALVVDNDWLLQRDLDIDKYLYAFMFSDIGAITFKPVHEGTNVVLEEVKLLDGSVYMRRLPAPGNIRFSFTAELGCSLITKRLFCELGRFKENCVTDETEWGFCNWYNALTGKERSAKGLWFATDKEMFHVELNGAGHVFTHVGINSQHPGPHKWDCPEEYRFLSDDNADELECEGALVNDKIRLASADAKPQSPGCIDWGKYFDKVYCLHHLPQRNKVKRLKAELSRVGLWGNPVFEMRYTSPCKYDEIVWEREKHPRDAPAVGFVNIALEVRRILAEAQDAGYSRILLLENDVAFLRDLSEVDKILSDTPADCEVVQYDKFINDGLALEEFRRRVDSRRLNESFADSTCCFFTSAACFSLNADGIRGMLRILDNRICATDLTFSYMVGKRAVAIKNLCVQVFAKGSWSISHDGVSYMHKVYLNGGVNYADYNLPSGYGVGSVYDDTDDTCSDSLCAHEGKHRKFISVYAIAKNEASVAARWYDCVKEADEVCVLDTGSTDDTVQILRSLGAKVTVNTYDDWSFAVARNDSMKLVSPEADILFTLDLDETIAHGWRKRLEDAWISEEEKGNAPKGVVYKYIWSWLPDGKEAQSFSVLKVHANGTGFWKYRCHELLCGVDGYRFFLPDFVVEHHQNRQTNRSAYLPLLEKDAKEMPDDDRSAYYFARELMYAGRWQESIAEFRRHLALPSARWNAERASSMRNIASCYGHLGDRELCELWLRKSADEDPTNREATYRLGEIAMDQKDYRAAVIAFRRCLAIEKPSLEYITVPVVWSGRPWLLYAQALWWTGDWKGAEEASRKALEIEPDNPEYRSQYDGMADTRKLFNK